MYMVKPGYETILFVLSYIILVRMVCYYLLLGIIAKTTMMFLKKDDKNESVHYSKVYNENISESQSFSSEKL